eukprot:g9165.t1
MRILFFLLPLSLRASHSASHALLSADSDRYREYVVDEHGKANIMRREGAPQRRLRNERFKSLLQKKRQDCQQMWQDMARPSQKPWAVERALRRQKLWNLEQEMNQVHMTSSTYQPKCTMLPDFRLKGEGGVAQAKDTIESCMAACRPRTNLAHGKSATALNSYSGTQPASAVDGKAETVWVSMPSTNPFWQVDLGLAKTIGDVWISLDTTDLAVQPKLVGAEVGLRDTACATGSSSNGELLEKLAMQIKGHQATGTCAVKSCGTISENSNFVNCKGQTGRFVVVKMTGQFSILGISQIEVWEDLPSHMLAELQDSFHLFAPILVGVRNSACPAEGCSKTGLLCGTLTVSKAAGPYIVDCGGKKAKYVWIELKGAGRSIHVSTVEVEKSANCEQVAAYSGLRAAAEEGAKYTSAICHTVGKRGPIGPQGPKGKQGEEGPAGGVGKAGEKGDVGEVGPVGEQGEAGEEGPEGIAADVTGLATMGQLNIAGGLCILVTVAIAVILMQKASPKSGRRASGGPPKEEAVEGEEGEAMPEEGEEAAEGEMMEEGEEQPM